jgi:hypothetical protein
MNMEQSVECELAGETEVLGENLPQCQTAWLSYKPNVHISLTEDGIKKLFFIYFCIIF